MEKLGSSSQCSVYHYKMEKFQDVHENVLSFPIPLPFSRLCLILVFSCSVFRLLKMFYRPHSSRSAHAKGSPPPLPPDTTRSILAAPYHPAYTPAMLGRGGPTQEESPHPYPCLGGTDRLWEGEALTGPGHMGGPCPTRGSPPKPQAAGWLWMGMDQPCVGVVSFQGFSGVGLGSG